MTQAEQTVQPDLSLGDFVKFLAAKLQLDDVSIPFKNERPWHTLLYDLKRDQTLPSRPAMLDSLRFDWDGSYPRCQELSEFLHALHWTAAVGAVNPSYENLTIHNTTAAEWSQIGSGTSVDGFLSTAAERAKLKFQA